MDSFEILKQKLESFIRRFYLNQLLKGLIYFTSIGLLYFLFTLFVEYLLWLNPLGRTFLFWTFVLVEVFLFGRLIVYPLLKLFRISGGIDHEQASIIIGKHFPEVQDKLLNVLQLKKDAHQSELLIAGIEQKANDLRPVPFSLAINYRKNLPLLRFAAIPVLVILAIYIAGKEDLFTSSYERVVNYKLAYEPPAPFTFLLKNRDLKVRENESLTLQVATEGEVIPENVSIHFEGQSYFLNKISPGVFEYKFEQVTAPFSFQLSANDIYSLPFSVEVIEVPGLQNIKMELEYPSYTKLPSREVEGTGNATVPEGTVVNWQLSTRNTESVELKLRDSAYKFIKNKQEFRLQKRLMKDQQYQISTSNRNARNYEQLNYALKVVKDELPRLELEHKIDSVDMESHYFHGRVMDDYGISRVRLVAHPVEQPKEQIRREIPVGKGTLAEFITAFPDTLDLQKGVTYEFFFEVFDNDGINGAKKVKSESFFFRRKTIEEEKLQQLEQQQNAIEGIDESLRNYKQTEMELEDISQQRKQKGELNYNDRKKLQEFLKRQKQQNEIMKSFSEKLKNTLKKEENTHNSDFKDELEKRIEDREEELQQNEELMKELEKYTDKIQDEGLTPKLDELSKRAKNDKKNLEQLLELTKRYYVQEKVQQLAENLEKLAEKQDKLSEKEQQTSTEQDSLNSETGKPLEELEELRKENEELKHPFEGVGDKEEEREISEEQEKASESLQEKQKENAQKSQKRAAEKMQALAKKMKRQNQAGEMQQMEEDADMLRKILDNLITFSFEQEEVLKEFQAMRGNSAKFSSQLRRQNVLKENFRHIDDSLFALGMRNPMISEIINKKISDVDYNLDQSLDRFAQNEITRGVGSQQYVMTGANDLALLLNTALQKMEQMMSMSGSGGKGKGMQLPDIIKKQEELNKEMRSGTEQKEGKGEKQEGKSGTGEDESGEIFEIYKQQQMLRKALEEEMKKNGVNGNSRSLQEEMKQVEKELLEKGFDEETLQRMQRLEHRLLDLEKSETEEGKKEERESRTNTSVYENRAKNQILKAKEYFISTEILNRQSLPLRPNYKLKVKEYFDGRDN